MSILALFLLMAGLAGIVVLELDSDDETDTDEIDAEDPVAKDLPEQDRIS